jgi:hypothetical protein
MELMKLTIIACSFYYHRAELIVMAEEAVSDMPLDNIEWYHEKYILDYFAEVGLFLKHGLDVFAELTLRQLIVLRCDSPDIGPDHHETWHLQKYLEQALRSQEKIEEADELKLKIEEFGMSPYVSDKQSFDLMFVLF